MTTKPPRRIAILVATLTVAALPTVTSSEAAVPPPLVAAAPATTEAGTPIQVTATYGDGVDCPVAHPDRFGFVWGDGKGTRVTAPADDPCVATASHTFAEEGNYLVVVRAFRNEVLLQADRAQVAVTNAVPSIEPIADTLAPLRLAFSPAAVLSDGDGDRSTVKVDWGDGSRQELAGLAPGPLPLTHTYPARALVTVTVTADDGEGGVAAVSFQVRVVPTCAGRLVTIDGPAMDLASGEPIVGTDGPDVILGTLRPDVIFGGDGDDVICGIGADDVIHGGAGNDTLYGGAGDDIIYGDAGDDILHGDAGDDTLFGGPGIDDCGLAGGVNCELTALGTDDTGPIVRRLQEQLADKTLYRGPIDGVYDTEVATAVVAFHKATDQPRTSDWSIEDWRRLAGYTPWVPSRSEADRVEVDIGRQTLTLVIGGVVRAVIPVSTGGGYVYYSENVHSIVGAHTPRGHFHLYDHANGWQCSYIGCIYYPFYFSPHYAIHGYPRVPEYPASHGCVRVPTWEAEYLDGRLYVGMAMYVWDEPPG